MPSMGSEWSSNSEMMLWLLTSLTAMLPLWRLPDDEDVDKVSGTGGMSTWSKVRWPTWRENRINNKKHGVPKLLTTALCIYVYEVYSVRCTYKCTSTDMPIECAVHGFWTVAGGGALLHLRFARAAGGFGWLRHPSPGKDEPPPLRA